MLWFCARAGAQIRDSLVERDHVRWTASLDHVVVNALVDQQLCDVALVDGAAVGSDDLVRRLLHHSLVVWIGETAPGEVWLQLDPSSSPSSISSALQSAIRYAQVRRAPIVPSFEIIGRSYAVRHLRRAMSPVARSTECALITGPSGVGKQQIARELHARSARPGSLVHVHCASDSIMEHLFGDDGALTPRRGNPVVHTLVLHEVHFLPDPVQRRLCSWLREPSGIRLVSLSSKAPSDTLNQELFFRLAAIHLRLPGLADRAEDVEPLVEHLLEQLDAQPATSEALKVLSAWSWPGNVTELQTVLTQACIESAGEPIEARHLPRRMRTNTTLGPALSVSHDRTLASMEQQTITRALVRLQGNVTEVGRELGISRSTLYRKLRKYGLR